MDNNDFELIASNHAGLYNDIEELAEKASTSDELGQSIRDLVRGMVGEDGSAVDLLWGEMIHSIQWRVIGETYWGEFRSDDDDNDSEGE